MKLFPLLALVLLVPFTAHADVEQVDSLYAQFRRDGLVLKAGSRTLLDFRSYLQGKDAKQNKAKLKILSAGGDVVSVLVDAVLCSGEAEGCVSFQSVRAVDDKAKAVPLPDLLEKGSLLRALKQNKFLRDGLRADSAAKYDRFAKATSLEQVQRLLAEGFDGAQGHVSLAKGKLDTYSFYDFNADKSLLTVRLWLEAEQGPDTELVPLTLTVEPIHDFNEMLVVMKGEGKGRFEKP